MTLIARISKEQHTALSEDIQKEYKTDGDGFLLDVQGAGGLQLVNVTDLQNALQQERRKASDAEKTLKKFKLDDGTLIDIEKAKNALSKMDEIDSWDPEQKLREHKERFESQTREKWEKEKKQLVEKHQSDLEVIQKESTVLTSQLDETLRKNTAIAAINAAGGSVRGLLPLVMTSTRVVRQDDGKRIVEVVGDNGMARLSPASGNSGLMSVEELIKELRNDKELAGLYRGSGARGSGASDEGGGSGGGGSGSGGTGTNPFLKGTWNLTAQATLKQTDPGGYAKLQKEAAAKEPEGMAAKQVNQSELKKALSEI